MEDIRLYDFEFDLKHIENDIVSSNWMLYHNDVGKFEAHFNTDSDVVPHILSNPYLVAVQGSKQAIIPCKDIVTQEFDAALYGRTVNWLLTKRTIAPFSSVDLWPDGADAETIARYIAETAFSDVENFELGDAIGLTEPQTFVLSKRTAASAAIEAVLALDNAGHKLYFDVAAHKWVFQVSKGTVLDLIISEGNNNAYETEYTEDMQGYYTAGWYDHQMVDMGDWDAAHNLPALVNNDPGNYGKYYKVTDTNTVFDILFNEGDYIICRDASGAWINSENTDDIETYIEGEQTGIYKWEGLLDGGSESEAKTNLASKKWSKEVQTKTRDLVYGVDYKLGDTVNLQAEIGQFKETLIKRIVGVNLWYENNDEGEKPIFEE